MCVCVCIYIGVTMYMCVGGGWEEILRHVIEVSSGVVDLTSQLGFRINYRTCLSRAYSTWILFKLLGMASFGLETPPKPQPVILVGSSCHTISCLVSLVCVLSFQQPILLLVATSC